VYQVKDQEAVDYVKEALLGSSALYEPIRAANGQQQHRLVHAQDGDDLLVEACKGLIRIACSRGGLDDITVMIVILQQNLLVLHT
jgi:serine/threonine protein phosphatase PrpC